MFLLNLEIWGSYDSLDVTDDKIFTVELARSCVEYKILVILESLMMLIKQENVSRYPFLQLLISKAQVIGYFFSKIACSLMKANSNLDFKDPFSIVTAFPVSEKSDEYKEEETTTLVSGDTESNQESLHFINQKGRSSKFDLNEKCQLDLSEITNQTVGYYIPLSCGHCGAMSYQEKALLSNHLKDIF